MSAPIDPILELIKERNSAERERDEAEDKLEVMAAKAAGWRNQAELDARLLVTCREKAERYRLEANAMMAKLHELQTYADKLADGLPTGMLPRDVENLREANAGLAEDLQKAEQEMDKLKSEKEANHQCLLMLERDIYKAREERDEAREALKDANESVVTFGVLWANQYAAEHGLPKGHLHPAHYDILQKAGARMNDFTRAELREESK